MSKCVLLATSYVSVRPTSQSDFSSSISGCKLTSIFVPGYRFPRIKTVRNINSRLIHKSGGRLYGVKMTGQQEYAFSTCPKGLNPSVYNPNLTFRGSLEKSG